MTNLSPPKHPPKAVSLSRSLLGAVLAGALFMPLAAGAALSVSDLDTPEDFLLYAQCQWRRYPRYLF